MAHKFTKEIIFHYTCSKCKNWWSYASADGYNPVVMYCPHCAAKDSTEENFNARVK
jgi:ribosomal protein L44E